MEGRGDAESRDICVDFGGEEKKEEGVLSLFFLPPPPSPRSKSDIKMALSLLFSSSLLEGRKGEETLSS